MTISGKKDNIPTENVNILVCLQDQVKWKLTVTGCNHECF